MKYSLSAALLLSLALAASGTAATKKKKSPDSTPSTLPPTSPMLVVPQPDPTDGGQSDKLISSEMSGRDLEFFTKVSDAGRETAFFVGLLKKSASSDMIKKLADALNAAQSEENLHIGKLASQKGWSLSLQPTAQQKKAGEEISKLSGSNLDKAAMDRIVAASNEALGAYQEAAQSSDTQIKTFAVQMLPLAEEKRHLVEKMTGAGAKAANQLFRHGGTTPNVAPTSSEPSSAEKEAPAETEKPAPESPAKAPAKPEGKDALNTPKSVGLPVATPPGSSTPPPILPPITPPQAPPTPER